MRGALFLRLRHFAIASIIATREPASFAYKIDEIQCHIFFM